MKKLKTRILFIAIVLIISTLALTHDLSALEREKKRGYKGNIKKEKILSKFAKGKSVEYFVIKGDDIIQIIKEKNCEIKISHSIIEGGLDFTKLPAEPPEKAQLPKNWDEKEREAFFKRSASDVHIVTNKISIRSSEIRSKEPASGSIYAENTLFHEMISFEGTIFKGSADFSEATFSGEADFSEATFSGEASFQGATFSGEANFSWATFRGPTYVSRAIFSGEVYFREATFSGLTHFSGAIFSCGADFSEVTFSGLTYFSEATFSGVADFSEATFSGVADFPWATFSGGADFSGATFTKLAYFKDTMFNDVLLLTFADIKIFADFRNTKIGKLNFNNWQKPTVIEGRIDFREAVISEAHFQDIIFEKDVEFSDAKFGIPGKDSAVVFRFVTFESDTSFVRTKFSGNTAFERVMFKKDANFTDAYFGGRKGDGVQRFSLSYFSFNNLRMRWEQLPNPESWVSDPKDRIKSFSDIERKGGKQGKEETATEDRERLEPLAQVLKSLEANFRSLGQLSDANIAYYHMKNAELKEDRKKEDGDEKAIWEWFPKQAPWIVWGLTCGYGTKIVRILGWCILFDLLFTIIYSVGGNLKRQSPPKTKEEFTFKQRLFDFPRLYLTEYIAEKKSHHIEKFWNALRFSWVILLKVGYRDTTISGKIIGIDYKYIVWTEWLLGFYLLASLAVTLSNTLPIVNRLITGVF